MITQAQKAEALEAIKMIGGDIAKLASGDWTPDDDGCEATLDTIERIRAFVESVQVVDPAPAKKALSLLKTDNDNCCVYYNGERGSLYCFLKESHTSFALYLCTVSGEPSSPVDLSGYQVDAVPCGDSSTAAAFRAWHNKRTDI